MLKRRLSLPGQPRSSWIVKSCRLGLAGALRACHALGWRLAGADLRQRRACVAWVLAAAGGLAVPRQGVAAGADANGFFGRFAGLRLLDHNARRFRSQSLLGRTVLVNFVFTGCSTTCPMQMLALAELQRQLPADVRRRTHFLSVSIDPLQDTPEALKAFAGRMGADLRGWTLLTGDPVDIDQLADSLRLFRTDAPSRTPDDHSTALWLVDARGQLRQRFGGDPPDVPRLVREITVLDRIVRP